MKITTFHTMVGFVNIEDALALRGVNVSAAVESD